MSRVLTRVSQTILIYGWEFDMKKVPNDNNNLMIIDLPMEIEISSSMCVKNSSIMGIQ